MVCWTLIVGISGHPHRRPADGPMPEKSGWPPLPPVVLNTLLVGAVIAYEESGPHRRLPASMAITADVAPERPSPAMGWGCSCCGSCPRSPISGITAAAEQAALRAIISLSPFRSIRRFNKIYSA